MNNFPPGAMPQFQHGFPQQRVQPGQPGPGGPVIPQGMTQMDATRLIMMQQQQNYISQQQQMAAHQQMMLRQQQQQQQAQAHNQKKQKKNKPQAQVMPRMGAHPHATEHYVKNAMMAPPGGMMTESVEPWADLLDELDPRELAMNRYRARNEMMAEVFGPEQIKEIPESAASLEDSNETLEAKVLELEKSNDELEANFESELDAFRKRLAAGTEGEVSA